MALESRTGGRTLTTDEVADAAVVLLFDRLEDLGRKDALKERAVVGNSL